MKTRFFILVLFIMAAVILLPQGGARAAEKPLKFGALPVIQALPLYVAQEKGLFAAEGLNVDLIPFKMALEKDVALSSGNLDGNFADLFTPIVLRANGVDLRIVARNFKTGKNARMFAVMTSPKSGITDLKGLSGVAVGGSSNTIIDYITTKILSSAGLEESQIQMMEVKSIPLRFQMLSSNQLKAATLPEPLATLAEFQGCRIVGDDRDVELSNTVYVFSAKAIKSRSGDIEKFLAAVNKAVDLINEKPEEVRSIMNKNCNIPMPLWTDFGVPRFPKIDLPEKEKIETVISWLAARGSLKKKPEYEDVINERFVR
ncbi:MAG: ABC transporter substrate-binding protein [Deltaproteobacteria bacterium]|nr:ABC transporter substrate-binding protein [Deltaproteobacteria bacterium]